MPTLQWIGKEAVVGYADKVPFRVLEKKYTFGDDDANGRDVARRVPTSNKIIHGDNLEALKALLPEYEGRIKCIYIDPPYNTGKENWVYNDNVNSPRIRKWLGQVVGKEAEDLSRHDKWLCMMYPRLKLLQKLLSNDGAIFISIDDNEQANLKLICDEIFGANNFEGCIHWRRRHNQPNDKTKLLGLVAEFILVYAKDSKKLKECGVGKIKLSGDFKNPDNDIKGSWISNPWKAAKGRGGCKYSITTPTGKVLTETWYGTSETFSQYLNEGRVHWTKSGDGIPRIKIYKFEAEEQGQCATNWWTSDFAGCNQNADAELKEIFNEITEQKSFDTPKPSSLIEIIIGLSSNKDSIILDSFAGSGTTAHAVLNLNKADGGNRKFILVEMEDYAESITAERVKRVIDGYGDTEGTGGEFDFYELGEPVFDEDKNLNENIGEEKIREYIWFSETHIGLQAARLSNADEPSAIQDRYFLGKYNNCGYWFFYQKETETTLDDDFLKTMSVECEQYVIYADKCILPKDFFNFMIFYLFL